MNIDLIESYLLKSVIKTGDLIFITVPKDPSKKDLANAIYSSTGTGNENSIHVGILKNDLKEGIKVIEANTTKGVTFTPLKTFLEENLICNSLSRFYVKRIKVYNEENAKRWINEAESHIGKKYNYSYLPSKDSLYCSELVYISYKNKDGKHLFNEIPMNFKDKNGKFPQYWIDNYKKLNMEIPQSKMGTNPNDMMNNNALLDFVCEIKNNKDNKNINYSFYKIENDTEVFNETKKALNENNTDIWTQFEKKVKLNENFEAIGTRKYKDGKFQEYNYMKMSECFALAEEIGNGLASIGLKENDIVLEIMNQRIEIPIINMGIWRQGGIIAPKSQGNIGIKECIHQLEPILVILTPEYIDSFYDEYKELKIDSKLKIKNTIILPQPNGLNQDKEELNDDIIKKYNDLDIKIYKYNEIINLGKKNKFVRKNINPENIAFILNSSGTSQTNIKSICLSHKNVVAIAVINTVYIKGCKEYKILLHSTFGHASDCLDNAWAMICPYFSMGYVSDGQNNYFEDLYFLKPNAFYTIPITLKKLYDEYNMKLKESLSKEDSIRYILNNKLGGNIKYVNCFGCGVSKEITDWCIDV